MIKWIKVRNEIKQLEEELDRKMSNKLEKENTVFKRLQDEITGVIVFKNAYNDVYTIHFRDKSIRFSHKQLINPKIFIEKYIQVFGELLVITKEEWVQIFNEIISPENKTRK